MDILNVNGMIRTDSYSKNTKTYSWYKISNRKIIEQYTTTLNVSPNYTNIECDICYETKSDWIVINKCKHKLCYSCLNNIVHSDKLHTGNFRDIEHYNNFILNNSFVKCPFCRCSFSFLDTSQYIKSKLPATTREVVGRCKKNRYYKHKLHFTKSL